MLPELIDKVYSYKLQNKNVTLYPVLKNSKIFINNLWDLKSLSYDNLPITSES